MRQEIINGIDAILEINHEYEFSKRTGITDSNPMARHYSFNLATISSNNSIISFVKGSFKVLPSAASSSNTSFILSVKFFIILLLRMRN